MTRKDFIRIATCLGSFKHYLLNDNAWLVKANTIFNLGVGEKIYLFTDYRISVNGKSRAGNVMFGGK